MNNITHRLSQLQDWIEKQSLNALISSHADEYLSEYVPPENERLAWATGFTGSAGLAMEIPYWDPYLLIEFIEKLEFPCVVDSDSYEILILKNFLDNE